MKKLLRCVITCFLKRVNRMLNNVICELTALICELTAVIC